MNATVSSRSRRAALAALLCTAALAGCGSSGSSSAAAGTAPATASGQAAGGAGDTIVIKNFMFSPASLNVAPGTVVTVRNEDSVTHTVTDKADPTLFGTGDVAAGQSKTFKAPAKPGSYAFICMIHQYMSGTLVVR
jgi:plastocyanin